MKNESKIDQSICRFNEKKTALENLAKALAEKHRHNQPEIKVKKEETKKPNGVKHAQ